MGTMNCPTLRQGKSCCLRRQYGAQVLAAAFHPDGHELALAGSDRAVRRFNANTLAPQGVVVRHLGSVTSVKYILDGDLLVTASDDNTARLWHAKTGIPVGPPYRHDGAVTSLAVSIDGSTIATGGQDGMANVWNLARPNRDLYSRELLRTIECKIGLELVDNSTQVLTTDEWRRRRHESMAIVYPVPKPASAARNSQASAYRFSGSRLSALWITVASGRRNFRPAVADRHRRVGHQRHQHPANIPLREVVRVLPGQQVVERRRGRVLVDGRLRAR